MAIAQDAENLHHLQDRFVIVFRKPESRFLFQFCRPAYQRRVGIQFGDWNTEIQYWLNPDRSLLFPNSYFRDNLILLEVIDQLWVS